MKEFKITMKAARVNAGLTQPEIAEKMELCRQTIADWECGKTVPKKAQFAMYCSICGMPEENIFLPKRTT